MSANPPTDGVDPAPPQVFLTIMDRVDGTATLLRSDGKEARVALPGLRMASTSVVERMTYVPGAALVHFETTQGDQIVAELPRLGDLAPLPGRQVVYLDQNHWSTIAKAIHDPQRVTAAAERDAAEHLIDLALARKVILPISAGHMSETCKWTDELARYQLALTILQLSGGWQMRDPLAVRRFELRQAFTVRFKVRCLLSPATFTLEPDAIHGEVRGQRPLPRPSDLPEDAALAARALTAVSGNFDTMLDAEPVEMGESPGWVDKLQRFTDWMASEERDAHRRRQRTNLMFVSDLGRELAEEAHRAGITPAEMSEWTRHHSDEDIKTMPSLGLFREVLHEKLLDRGTRWESNDLTDLMYLTCAAGYADHIVGERRVTAHLEPGLRRLGRPAKVHRRLADLVNSLRAAESTSKTLAGPPTSSEKDLARASARATAQGAELHQAPGG